MFVRELLRSFEKEVPVLFNLRKYADNCRNFVSHFITYARILQSVGHFAKSVFAKQPKPKPSLAALSMTFHKLTPSVKMNIGRHRSCPADCPYYLAKLFILYFLKNIELFYFLKNFIFFKI